MASPPPPAPPPPSPSIPLPPTLIPVFSSKALDEQARSAMATAPPAPPPPSIPQPSAPTAHLLHGGVGRTADPGSEGCEMSTYNMGMVGGQDDIDGGDPQIGRDNGGKLQQCKNMVAKQNRPKNLNHRSLVPDIIKVSHVQVGEGEIHTKNPHPKPILKKSSNRKGHVPIGSKSASPRLRSPMQVASSPGVNMFAKSKASRRASSMVRSAALKRAKMEGCPESSKQSPSCDMTSPIPDLPHISPSLEDLSPDTRISHSQALKRKRRKLISAIWTEAIPIYRDGKLVEGRCMHCRQVFAAARDKGTRHLKRHLKVCEAKTAMNEMIDKMGHPEGVDPNWKFDPVVARRKLVKLIVVNEMPFSFVEYKPFREFAAALNPWFEKVSRTTIKECMTVFNNHGNKLKECFEHSDARISLTGDMWTSNQKLGYFCMTCHIISSEWVLHKRIIRFSMLETPHNSWNMFNVVLKTIQEWNLEDKLFSFTLDNAVNTAMVNLLRDNLKNKGFLPIEGKLLHFRCRTHVLNIIAQDGLREIKPVVNNIRESAKFVKSSQGRIEKFLEIIKQEGLTGKYKSLSVDVTTRWNSIYLMLEAALPLRNAFYSLEKQDKDYTFAPSPSEWKIAEAVCKLLEIFYTATVTLSGSNWL